MVKKTKKGRGRGRKAPPLALVKATGELAKVVKYHGLNRFHLQLPSGSFKSFHRNELVFTNNPTKKPTNQENR